MRKNLALSQHLFTLYEPYFIKEDAEAVKLRNKLDIWEGSSVESVLKNYGI